MTSHKLDKADVYRHHAASLGTSPDKLRTYVRRLRLLVVGVLALGLVESFMPAAGRSALSVLVVLALGGLYVHQARRSGARQVIRRSSPPAPGPDGQVALSRRLPTRQGTHSSLDASVDGASLHDPAGTGAGGVG